ncbi:hypothetical protein [Pseudobacteroides sp.]
MLQVADSYSAIIIKRVYRKTFLHEEALDEIVNNSGIQYDSKIAKYLTK